MGTARRKAVSVRAMQNYKPLLPLLPLGTQLLSVELLSMCYDYVCVFFYKGLFGSLTGVFTPILQIKKSRLREVV